MTFFRRARTLVVAATLLACGMGCSHYVAPEALSTLPPNPAGVVIPADASLTPQAADLDSVSVEEALERVLRTNPELQAAFENLQAADADRVQASAWRNPMVDLEVEGIGGDRNGFDESEITLKLGLPLELFGTRGLRAQVGEARTARERARYHEVRRDLAARTWVAFHRAMAAREAVRIARQRVSVTDRTASTVSAQVEAGKASPLGGARAAVESETARATLESAIAGFDVAREELMALWQASNSDSLVLEGELRSTPTVVDRQRLADELLAAHPALLAARWEVERGARAERLASRQRLPDIVPNAGVRWNRGSDTQDFVAGLMVGLPILDRRGGARRAAQRRTEAAAHTLDGLGVALLAELHTTLEEVEARHRALAVYENDIVPQAQRALELARTGYEGGKFGYIDLLDAQRTVIDIGDGRAQALIAYDRALVRLESLLGRRLSRLEDQP
jgi:cobalt-zinc-cadmium efflux system outer membrane protein